jgi:hypothetical protein
VVGHYECVSRTHLDDNRLARPVFLVGAIVAAVFSAWDLVANFTPSDLIGVVFLIVFGGVAVRSIRRSSGIQRPSNPFWVNLAAVVLTMCTVGFVHGVIWGAGDRQQWFIAGFGISGLWLVLAQAWFPPHSATRPIGVRRPTDA